MKNLFKIGFLIVCLCISCNNSDSPSNTVKLFYKNFEKGKLDKCSELLYSENSYDIDVAKKMMKARYEEIKNRGGIKNVTINYANENDNGKTAEVSYSLEFKDGSTYSQEASMIKINNKWKLE
ncbi:DUF4878 domain-containing protein [Bacteroidota bacterium]